MRKYLFFLCLAIVPQDVFAQAIIVQETSADPLITLDLNKNPIVDINGKLTIQISIPQLTVMLTQNKKGDPATANKLKALIYVLQNQEDILLQLTPAIRSAAGDLRQLSVYSRLMADFYERLKSYPDIREDVNNLFMEGIGKYRRKTLDTVLYPTIQGYVIKNLSAVTDKIVSGLEMSQGLESIQIQVAAFLNTTAEYARKVHIENFDNYSAGEYYEVPRWVTSFSQDDMNAFNQASQLSTSLNTLIGSNFSDLSKLIPDSLNAYKCFASLISDLQTKANSAGAQASGEITAFISNTEKKLGDVFSTMETLQQQKNSKAQNVLQQFNQVGSAFFSLANDLPTVVAALENGLSATALQTYPQLNDIKNEINNCLGVLKSDVNTISAVYNTAANLLQPFQSTANAVQQVTGNVLSNTMDNLPSSGYIDLKTTGKRENGDQLIIKVISQTADDEAKHNPGQILETRTIELQQISFYSESNVSVILASPIGSNSNVTLKSTFQFAPSASLLVKFGSRTCRFWNTINPGLGFNISTPDFNLDGSPDISYGAVVTLFRNVLSAGLAYDTKTSSPFWFFGLSLPFSTLGLPVGNVQTQKQ